MPRIITLSFSDELWNEVDEIYGGEASDILSGVALNSMKREIIRKQKEIAIETAINSIPPIEDTDIEVDPPEDDGKP